MSGLFITFEGMDGAGKTTQAKMLESYLSQKGYDAMYVREPGGVSISEKIRNIIIDKDNNKMSAVTEALLYAAARAQLVKEVIEPNLKDGKIIISDRFIDSSIVYQGYGRGLGEDMIENINKYAAYNITPDITFFIKISVNESIKRLKNNAELDRIESESMYFHKMVYTGYARLSKKYSKRIKELNGKKSIYVLQQDIINIVENIISERSL